MSDPRPRYRFIGQALSGEGGFRPSTSSVIEDGQRVVMVRGECHLVRYSREGDQKFGRRAELAFYASPMAQACSRFVGYLSTKPPLRTLQSPLYQRMGDDIDGQGNSVEVFFQQFMAEAKARGAMLLLVDKPNRLSANLAEQLAERNLPRWMQLAPEELTAWRVGGDGRFDYVEFEGAYVGDDGESRECTWRFDRLGWAAIDHQKKTVIESGEHLLGECPVIIFSEGRGFPHFGPFAPIADLSRRLFNLDSELDEILRSQTFSLLTMQVPDESTSEQKLSSAQVAGQTIGSSNMLVHSGSTPAFIAPPDGPARVYLDRIEKIERRIREIGLDVATVGQQESGIAMRLRFQAINAELSRFASRMEDFERRAWDLSRRWLYQKSAPLVEWQRDYQIADVMQELQILAEMQATAMPARVISEQRFSVISAQFGASAPETIDELRGSVDEMGMEMPAA